MSQDSLAQITEIMRDLFDEYEGPVTPAISAKDVGQWDSLAHVQFIVMVEQACGVKFSTSEIQSFATLGDLIGLIEKKKA